MVLWEVDGALDGFTGTLEAVAVVVVRREGGLGRAERMNGRC
jgi:hypothetical protein